MPGVGSQPKSASSAGRRGGESSEGVVSGSMMLLELRRTICMHCQHSMRSSAWQSSPYGYSLETGQRPGGVLARMRSSRDDASQVRADRFAHLSSSTRPTQIWCSHLSRCQHLLNGSQKRCSCLPFAEMVEQELP